MRTRSSKGNEMDVLVEKTEEPIVQEEPTSTEPIFTTEDVERANGLFTEGKRHFICGSSADAAKALAEACSIFGGYYGETARECADAFYYYGRTLLDLARKEPDVVANAVQGIRLENDGEKEEEGENGGASALPEPVDKEQNDESETEEEVREKVWDAIDECTEALEKEATKKETDAAIDPEPVGETSAAKEEETPIIQEADEGEGDNNNEDEADTGEGDEENDENAEPVVEEEGAETVSNLQLSWEMLDLARAILEKFDDEPSRQRLADCRLALGEQAMEDEEFDKAISELQACIDLQKAIFSPDDRRIAVSYYNVGVTYNLAEKYEPAVDSFKSAITILEMRQSNLEKQLGALKDDSEEAKDTQGEIKELIPLIEDIRTRIQDCIDSHAQSDAKEALHELTAPQNGHNNGTSSEPVKNDSSISDVSHLVRKAVKHAPAIGDDADVETVTKKAKLDGDATNGENGHANGTGNGMGEEKAAA